jgi:hypothetical protein
MCEIDPMASAPVFLTSAVFARSVMEGAPSSLFFVACINPTSVTPQMMTAGVDILTKICIYARALSTNRHRQARSGLRCSGSLTLSLTMHSCHSTTLQVCNVAKKYFATTTATAFTDPRVTLVHDDAANYVKDKKEEYDVVIVDSSDPVGPAETLFTSEFYAHLRSSMKKNAIMCNQGECVWLHLELIGKCLGLCTNVFPSVDYAYTTIPTYPSGQIGFLLCSTTPGTVLRVPVRTPSAEMQAKLKHYTPALHAAAFVLPGFAEKVVSTVRKPELPSVCSSVVPETSGNASQNMLVGAVIGAACVYAAIHTVGCLRR